MTSTWQSDDGRIRLMCGDSLEILPTLPALSADLILTDPPYGIPTGAGFKRKQRMINGRGVFNETTDPYAWIPFAVPVLAIGGHLAFFLDRMTIAAAERACNLAGLAVWNKYYLTKIAPPPTPRNTFCSAVEECLIAERRSKGGPRRWYGGGYTPNRWIGCTPNRLGQSCGHPSEKPVDPLRSLMKALTPRDGLVLDPFCGSGTTGVACIQTGRRFIGIEREPAYFDIARKRLSDALQQTPLALWEEETPDVETVPGLFDALEVVG